MIGDKYKYLDKGSPSDKINYSYSQYKGKAFLDEWAISRKEFLTEGQINTENDEPRKKEIFNKEFTPTNDLLDFLLEEEVNFKSYLNKINLWVKRFEVTKKIYSDYNELMRPSNRNNFMDFSLYAKFGQLMAQLFIELNRYQYLNALLKINDIIISNKERLNQNEMKLCKLSVSAEYEIVRDELTKRSLD